MIAHPQVAQVAHVPQPQRANTKSIGHYILGRTIGEGTFGKVKLGRHILSGERVAVKVLEKERIVEVADVERIAREVHILKLIRHPHIAQLYEIIETRGQLYFIMEYASGGELFDYIVANGRVQEKEAASFFHQIIAGVEAIHQMHVVHRDLKPENLLLDEYKRIKIVDFGLSNVFRDGQLLKTACGSPCYAPPEMVAGLSYVPHMCDMWSCGVILFALVCGYLPFEDQNTTALYKKILNADYQLPNFLSEEVKDVIRGLLTTEPTRRMNIADVRAHAWYKQVPEASVPPRELAPGQLGPGLDEDVLRELDAYGFPRDYAVRCLELNKHNHMTTTYYLLLDRRRRVLQQLNQLAVETGESGTAPHVVQRQVTTPPIPSLALPGAAAGLQSEPLAGGANIAASPREEPQPGPISPRQAHVGRVVAAASATGPHANLARQPFVPQPQVLTTPRAASPREPRPMVGTPNSRGYRQVIATPQAQKTGAYPSPGGPGSRDLRSPNLRQPSSTRETGSHSVVVATVREAHSPEVATSPAVARSPPVAAAPVVQEQYQPSPSPRTPLMPSPREVQREVVGPVREPTGGVFAVQAIRSPRPVMREVSAGARGGVPSRFIAQSQFNTTEPAHAPSEAKAAPNVPIVSINMTNMTVTTPRATTPRQGNVVQRLMTAPVPTPPHGAASMGLTTPRETVSISTVQQGSSVVVSASPTRGVSVASEHVAVRAASANRSQGTPQPRDMRDLTRPTESSRLKTATVASPRVEQRPTLQARQPATIATPRGGGHSTPLSARGRGPQTVIMTPRSAMGVPMHGSVGAHLRPSNIAMPGLGGMGAAAPVGTPRVAWTTTMSSGPSRGTRLGPGHTL